MVFSLTIPSAAVGLWAVVPTGTLMASVVPISKDVDGEAVPIPTLPPLSYITEFPIVSPSDHFGI